MKNETMSNSYRTFSFGGGVVGLVTFLVVGLLPSIVYGGFAGVALASAILGGPVGVSIFARTLVVLGMTIGLLGTAGIFVVLGGALGAAIFHAARLAGSVGASAKADEAKTESHKA